MRGAGGALTHALSGCNQDATLCIQVGTSGMEWTLWDRYDIDEGRELTLREFIDLFKDKYKLEVTMISSGVSILYSFFTNQKKLKERYPMTMSKLVTEVSKTEFKPKQKYITFEICCNDMNAAADADEEDVNTARLTFGRPHKQRWRLVAPPGGANDMGRSCRCPSAASVAPHRPHAPSLCYLSRR